ncbi:ankyrin repeat and SOCS box protein 2-like isoform X2 [Gouania willdenowi]|uniref:ankyrin repeat and SOCS box protein 2-like isoform X2 n=1 Tax=Gouania willdenowi TaxID=441366 RepID=UPI001056C61F|nr:ankyrin repeat and SOCS box protein 2-like isoform X2 [Gouania willdenowi]
MSTVSSEQSMEDYSLYRNLSDDELLQVAIERSLSHTHNDTLSSGPESRLSSQNAPPAPSAQYSSPNPPSERPPDLKTFDGTISRFVTGSGKSMVAYRRHDGSLVHIGPEPKEEEEPLFKAIRDGDLMKVQDLLKLPETNLTIPNKQGWFSTHQAAFYGQSDCLQLLLSAQPRLTNQRTSHGESSLIVSVSREQLRCVQVLLENGADPDIPNSDNETPLYKGADVNSEAADGATALYEACKNGHKAVVEMLLSHNADANKPGKRGLLPLHIATQQGSDAIVSMLVPVTSKTRVKRSGISPLHLAAERNRDNILESLIEDGFDVNAELSDERCSLYEDRRRTVLFFSVVNNNLHATRLLLAAGADPNRDLLRPLMVAARTGCFQSVRLLVEHGAHINAPIPTHPTSFPAVYMFSMKNLYIFKYLLDHGGHAHSCFTCVYGSRPHPPIRTSRSEGAGSQIHNSGVQFCEMISVPSISRWAGPIIDVLLDYVGHVTLCSKLMEHLESFPDWSHIKDKAVGPRPLLHLCRLQIISLVGQRQLETLPIPGALIGYLNHKVGELLPLEAEDELDWEDFNE